MQMKLQPKSIQRGFTFVEMLVVVVILAGVSVALAKVASWSAEQTSLEETRKLGNEFKEAVTGKPANGLNSQSVISGYWADTGSLPTSAADLVSRPDTIPTWHFDQDVQAWAGWNGPYLKSRPELRIADQRFLDSWGNESAAATGSFGWVITANPATWELRVASIGKDGKSGTAAGVAYTNRYNSSAAKLNTATNASQRRKLLQAMQATPTEQKLMAYERDETVATVTANDGMVDIGGLKLIVRIWNSHPASGANACPLPPYIHGLRARINYPKNGSYDWLKSDSWPSNKEERDALSNVSDVVYIQRDAVRPGGSIEITFEFPPGKFVPWGNRSAEIIWEDFGTRYGLNEQSDDGTLTNIPKTMTLVPRTSMSQAKMTWLMDSYF